MAEDADIKAAVGRRRAQQVRLIPAETLKRLYVRSDAEGAMRLAGHLAVLIAGAWLIWLTRGTWWILPAMLLQGWFLIALFAREGGSAPSATHSSAQPPAPCESREQEG